MILFFDTETTGVVDFRMPLNHECQPHLVQLAALLTEDDGTEVACVSLVVDPGRPIPDSAAAIHGISSEKAARCGLSAPVAVAIFDRILRKADTVIAHNIKFDHAVMGAQWARYSQSGTSIDDACDGKALICTMEAAAPVLNLPPTERMIAAGFNKPKAPRLEECVQHFFGERLDGAHDALVDVRACRRVYFKLKEEGHIQ